MRREAVFWTFLAVACTSFGCTQSSQSPNTIAPHLRACLVEEGLESSEHTRWWTDPSGATLFAIGTKEEPSGSSHPYLMIVKPGRGSPTIVDLQNIDLNRQWIDTDGRVWGLPSYVFQQKPHGSFWHDIDQSSGLFIVYDKVQASGPLTIWIGRMNDPSGWLHEDTVPFYVSGALSLHSRGESFVVSERWNFCADGFKQPRSYNWVYSPHPDKPGSYIRTDSCW